MGPFLTEVKEGMTHFFDKIHPDLGMRVNPLLWPRRGKVNEFSIKLKELDGHIQPAGKWGWTHSHFKQRRDGAFLD